MADPPTAAAEKPLYDWDFFLAHAGNDLPVAQNLYLKLTPPAKVFLDSVSLLPGDDWDVTLSTAQRSSLISVILVSDKTDNAYYQREEIASAIDMARKDPSSHRVVPIYLKAIPRDNIPYGLRLKHSLYIPETGDLTEMRDRLLKTLEVMKHYEEKKVQVVADQRLAVERIVNVKSGAEVLAGFNEVTKFVRPLLYTLIVLLVVMVVMLGVSIVGPIEPDVRGLLAAVSGSLSALLLAGILWLSARSLKFAPQIAQGQINGG